MAVARTDAAARCSLCWHSFFILLVLLSVSAYCYHIEAIRYSRDELLSVSGAVHHLGPDVFIPPEIARPPPGIPVAAIRRRRRCERRRKRGKRAGVKARLKANPFKPPLPSIFLSNVRSIRYKMDEIRLGMTTRRFLANCCSMIFTETWLDNTIPDAAIGLTGFTVHRADRTADSGKKTGGGLCIYINNSWCTQTMVTDRLCCPDVEFMLLKCRPFYLPREFASVYICAVYIPPDANAKLALAQLHDVINNSLAAHPDSIFIAAGDFNHADLKSVLHKFHRSVKCATRGDKTLDQVYTNVADAYKVQVYPHLGLSDHLSLLLHPKYTTRNKTAGFSVRTVRSWPEDAIPRLQDCFSSTDWDIFKDHGTITQMFLYILGLLVIFYGYRWFKELKQVLNKSEKHVYITGCDTGFGNLLAKHLDKEGFCVIAGCYTEKGEIELKKTCSARLFTVQLDVSDNDSIKKAAGIINTTVGEKGLWAVVNNAGISQPSGPTEWMGLDDFKKIFSVNLLGVIAVTLSVLPFIKKAKGRVVNISSVNGRVCVNTGPYCISKYGVEAFNDCLRLNMAPFGVKVLCIEPGFFKTSMTEPSFLQHNLQKIWDRLPQDIRNDYGSEYIDKVKVACAERIGKRLDEDLWKVVSCMAHAVSAVYPRTRYSAGWDAKFFWLPLSYMPTFITDAILLKNTIKPKACI